MRQKFSKIIFIFLFIIILVALIKGIRVMPYDSKISTNDVIMLKNQWTSVSHQDQTHSYSEYMYIIPEDAGPHLMLSIENYWTTMDIYLDNDKIYSYDDRYEENGVNRQWIELTDDAPGKKLTIRSSSNEQNLIQSLNGNTYLGDKGAVYIQFFNDNLYALIFAVFSFILSGLVMLSSFSFRTQLENNSNKSIRNLALFILLTGIWILSDSQFLQYYTDKISLISLISFLSFIMFPIFLIGFVKEVLRDDKKIWNILRMLYILMIIIFLVVYIFHIFPFYKLIIIQHILLIITIIAIMKNCILEIQKYKNKELKEIMVGFGILFFFGLVALGIFYSHVDTHYSYIYSIGIIAFVFILIDVAYKRLGYYLKNSARTEIYKQLAYIDALTQLESRTAFVEEYEKDNSENLTYIVLDINHLKLVNDEYGHLAGDELIIAGSKCIQEVYQHRGRCYRIGGDEFVVILKNQNKEDIELSLQEFQEKLKELNETREIKIEIAYGYAIRNNQTISTHELFKKADIAMYQNKQSMKQ